MATTPIPHNFLQHLAVSIAEALGVTAYRPSVALMGGAALRLLGSKRPTAGVDLFVDDTVPVFKLAEALAVTTRFGKHGTISGFQLWYWLPDRSAAYKVTLWQPRQLGLPFPRSAGAFVTMHGARLLKPAVQLNFKCRGWADFEGCGDAIKQAREAWDILFLLEYMSNKGIKTTEQEVDCATEEFIGRFVPSRPETRKAEPLFRAIGLGVTQATGAAAPQGQGALKA